MLTEERNRVNPEQALSRPSADKTYLLEYSAAQIKRAFVADDDLTEPLEELVATCLAVFEFIRSSDMDMKTKSAFYQLEKQFEFYRKLLGVRE